MFHVVMSFVVISSVLVAGGPPKKIPPATTVTLSTSQFNKTEHQDRVRNILLYSPVQVFAPKFRIVSATQEQVVGTVHYRYRVVFADDPRQRPCELASSEPPRKMRKLMLEQPVVSYTCSYNPGKNVLPGVHCLGCPEVLSREELAKNVHEGRVERILQSEGIEDYSDLTIIGGVSEAGAGTKYKYNVEFVVGPIACALTAQENSRLTDPAERRQYSSLCSKIPMSY
ncbi:uncharacterized protein LOC120425375 [Culex pipiens pallens]|uniref:uncharacterized protein LOC120425375 n=1 Tax=Culex pipiens pallens TaxID=42434 RepID=UPI0019535934|nr:uncharacterized protein LOC120425375 [Culex pipiens pallens]